MSRVETIGDCTLVWIYALCDPGTQEPRYVGKTSGFMYQRHKGHIRAALKGSRLPVHSWLRGIIEAEKPLSIVALERTTGKEWASRERFWIESYRNAGVKLFNLTEGGEGLSGHIPTALHRERIAASLRTGDSFACENCRAIFWRKRNEIAKGNNRFCSRRCYQQFNSGKTKPVPALCTQRGVAAAAAERLARTHCKRGHPLSGENLFMTSAGARGCKECRKIHKIRHRSRNNG